MDLLDELLERQILVSISAERHLADAHEQLAERRITRQVRPED